MLLTIPQPWSMHLCTYWLIENVLNPGFSLLLNDTVRISLLQLYTPLKRVKSIYPALTTCGYMYQSTWGEKEKAWMNDEWNFAVMSVQVHTSWKKCVEEQGEACAWGGCEESTNMWEKKAKMERQHDSASFSASCVVCLCSSTAMTTTHLPHHLC